MHTLEHFRLGFRWYRLRLYRFLRWRRRERRSLRLRQHRRLRSFLHRLDRLFRLRHRTSSRWGARVIRQERRACCWEGRRQLVWMEALGLVGGKVWVWVRVAEVGVGVCRGGIRWVI